ncbi:MAG: hypothetical protein IT223_00970 [Crocinitomicaceae bacterium]|nr:hypothetical protein [Crocinitomicaceae bacterium]
MLKNLLYIALLITMSGVSCRDRTQEQLPQQSFDILININEPAFFDLSVPSGWVYYTGSNVRLIIYRKSTDEFMAYDARSTYNIQGGCYVEVASDNIIINDPCSGSQWIITDGSVSQGPATYPLISYDTTFNETTGQLTIMN